MIKLEGFHDYITHSYQFPFGKGNNYANTNEQSRLIMVIPNKIQMIMGNVSTFFNQPFWIILEYTKSTD